MIREETIAYECNTRAFRRGQQIAESASRDITQRKVRNGLYSTTVSAYVASSSGWSDRYSVSVDLDEDCNRIEDYYCTCPAYRTYDGLCKHCAAMLLTFADDPESFAGYEPHRTQKTSPAMAAFIARNGGAVGSATQVEIKQRKKEAGTISILPIIAPREGEWCVHFKITNGRNTYVMKHLSEFAERMEAGGRYPYGKMLEFAHVYSAFSEPSRQVAMFIAKTVTARTSSATDALITSRSFQYSKPQPIGRDLTLSNSELVELLDILAASAPSGSGANGASGGAGNTDATASKATFELEQYDSYYSKTVTRAGQIVHANPQIELEIYRCDDQGMTIDRHENLSVALFGNRSYVLRDRTFYRCSDDFAPCADFLKNVYDSHDYQLYISNDDLSVFSATVLPALDAHLDVFAPEELRDLAPIPCHLEFFFDRAESTITCELRGVYGQYSYVLAGPEETYDQPEGPGPLRDDATEELGLRMIDRYFHSATPIMNLADTELAAALLFGGLDELQHIGEVFTTDAFDKLLIDRKPQVNVGVSLSGDLIDLDVSSDDVTMEELQAILASYRQKKRYHRLKSGAFLSLEDYDLSHLMHILDDLDIPDRALTRGPIQVSAYRAFYFDQELADEDKDDAFMEYINSFRHAKRRHYDVPDSLERTLRPYQVEGFRWLNTLCDMGFGGILADEMGLGKSVQMLSLLLSRREEARQTGPTLIVCPASLVYNWMAELDRFVPQLTKRAIVGQKRDRTAELTDALHQRVDVLITSYDIARIDIERLSGISLFACVLDEAQYIKNHGAKTTRAIKKLDAKHRFALTGTPIENRLSELWSIFDFLMPGLLGSYMRFREQFELDIMGGDQDSARRLQALCGPFMLRRLKTEVLTDLPDKLESVVFTELSGEQRRLYAAHEQQLREALKLQKAESKKRRGHQGRGISERSVEVLAELMKLRQLCCDPHLLYQNYNGDAAKLDTILELVQDAQAGGEKALVFSQFTSFLALIASRLDEAGIPYFIITGSTPKKERLNLVNKFNRDETPVFLVSLKAGGTGLNLTGASVVVHADPWWNAAAQNQATDRAHRIGQTRVVSVQRVIAKDTIEERIIRLQEAKRELAEQVLGADPEAAISLATLTADDLMELLGA